MDKVIGSSPVKNRIFALAFALLWGGIVLVNFITPPQSFSQAENRSLASFPAYTTQRLLDGAFMEEMNTYLNDQFVGRPYWVSGQSLIEYGLGKREISGVYIGDNALYRHYTGENPTVTEANVDGVNAFAETYGIPTALMLVPSSTYVYRDSLPRWAPSWDEGAYIGGVYARLAGVAPVDVLAALQAQGGNAAYYRTDHHWTTHGAFLGYRQVAAAFGLPDRADELSITTVSTDFMGTNQSRSGFPLVRADAIDRYEIGHAERYETYGLVDGAYAVTEYDSIYFPEYLAQKDKYSYFLGGLQPYATIYTGADTDRKLIIFKDSYAHCLAPMLLADYSEIRLVDLRSFKAEDYGAFVDAGRYDEALFLYSTDTFAQQLGPGYFAA